MFYLGFNFGFCVSEVVHLWVRNLPRGPGGCVSEEPGRGWGPGLVDRKLVGAPRWFLLLAVPGRLFCFGSLVILDVARCYLWLFTLYINIKISKNGC